MKIKEQMAKTMAGAPVFRSEESDIDLYCVPFSRRNTAAFLMVNWLRENRYGEVVWVGVGYFTCTSGGKEYGASMSSECGATKLEVLGKMMLNFV